MRRYFMVNGPLGGNMGTPPVEPQPPQVSFTTTAESRGGFNNFLKSIPQTTAMTPIPPLGSAPTAPMSNPMNNIDIFNPPQNFLSGGLVQFGNDLMRSLAEPVNEKTRNIGPFLNVIEDSAQQRFGVDLSSLNNQNQNPFSPTGSIFQPPETSGGIGGGMGISSNPDSIPDSIFTPSNEARVETDLTGGPQLAYMQMDPDGDGLDTFGKPMRESTSSGGMSLGDSKKLFNNAFTQGASSSSSSAFGGGDSRVAGQIAGISSLASGIGGMPQMFYNGGEVDDSDFGGFSDYGSVDATSDDGFSEDNDVSDYSTDDSGVYTGGDDSNQDIALPTPRPEILKEAVGRAENQVFGDTEGDALGFFNKSGGLTDAGQKEYDNAIMANLDVLQDERPANTGIQLANVFDDQSILGDSTNNVNPADIVQASFKPGSLNPTFSNNVLDGLDLSASLGQNRNRNVEPEAFDMFGNPMSTLTNQPGVSISNRAMQQMVDNDLADRAFSKGNFSMIGPADEEYAGGAFPGKALTTQNVSPQNTADRIARNNRSINEIRADLGSRVPDTALENMIGRKDRLPDQVYDSEAYKGPVIAPEILEQSELDQAPSSNVFGKALNIDPNDRINFVPSTVGDDAFDDSTFIENPLNMVEAGGMGIPAPKEFKDPFPNAGIGAIPTLTSLANKFSAYSRGRVLDSIAQKGYTPVYDGDVIVGAKNKSGQLMEGMDPNAPMNTGDDNNENPLILRPIAKAPEEEKEEEKLPNVIGGGETPAPVSSGSVVVDSPFTSNVGNFIPSSFNTGELNKLIEALTGVASPRAMKQGGVAGYAEGGRVMQALDNLLATG